jgi:hypothetical protein
LKTLAVVGYRLEPDYQGMAGKLDPDSVFT